MSYVLLVLGILLLGVLLVVIGAVLLLLLKRKLAGAIVLGLGLLFALASFLAFLSVFITSRTMG